MHCTKLFSRQFFLALIWLTLTVVAPVQLSANDIARDLSQANFYFLIDADTKEIMLSRNADVRAAPSSMTKLMTAYVVFDQIKNGKIKFENQCLIGKDAFRKSGSSMFLNYGDVVSIDELIQGLLAVSGNDAAIALAETTGGGISNFVAMMNFKAQQLGMKDSHFRNPHGLPEEGHYMTLRDLANLTTHLYEDFPQYTHYLGISEFTYRRITQHNRHPLIKGNYDGTVGGKTGYTDDGGYGAVGVVKRDNRRLIAVVNKTRSPRQRATVMTALMDYGFDNYKKLTLFRKGQSVAKVKTWLGNHSELPVIVDRDIAINIPVNKSASAIRISAKYRGPIYTPIKEMAEVAKLIVEVPGYKSFEFPLFAKERVERVGFLRKVKRVLFYKVSKFIHSF